MVQPGLHASRLLNLPQRPPTPPRESENGSIHTESSKLRRTVSNHLGENTPPQNSPSSSIDSTQPSSSKSSKKVAWSAWNEYKDPPQKGSTPQSSLRQLPSSGELKPAKSILKPYNGVNAVDRRGSITKSAAPHTYPNFATMLESIVKQLAGEDRSSRIDAYLTLSGALKASENIPDLHALKEKTSLLSQFIQRDISAKNPSGTLDTGLITSALTLLACLIWKPTIADCFSVEFCSHIIEHSISAIRDPEAPKDVIKHLLFILGQQSFSPKTMILDRVRRLIEALGGMDSQVKARSIVLGRIAVYRKLLRQARMPMLSNLCWVEDLFADMTSNIKEVRTPAVTFGFEASLQLGAEKQASRAVMDLFCREQEEATYADYYKDSLISMIRQKLDGHLVPQIWSIVVLFMRARPHQLEHWEFITPWLQVIEKCFNSGDHEIKIQAYSAWNRFVFAVRLSESTTSSMIKFLGKALEVPLLKRKIVGKNAKQTKQATMGSICNLIYYALRPDATTAQLDLYWDEYIVQVVGNTLIFRDQETPKAEQEGISQACEIIAALLDTTPKAWNNNRANATGPVKAEELPGIDAKWIRKNAQRVFKVLGPLLEKCFRDLNMWESSAILIWSRFISCVAAAGAKEVKVSNDTMSSMACIFGLLYKLWENGPRNLSSAGFNASLHFQKVFANLITTTTSTLGLLPFTEKLLSMGPQESFVIVATPSHSPFKARGEVKCPLHHLFILMTRPAAEIECDVAYEENVKTILNPFFEVRKTRSSQIELLIDLFQLLPFPNSTHHASNALWKVIASYATVVLNSKPTSGTSGSSSGSYGQPLGAEYRSFIKLLEYGAMLFSSPLEGWKDLFVALSDQVTLEAGESGRAIAVIEPLARIFGDSLAANTRQPSLGYCPILLSKVVYPRDMQALDASRRLLWGTSNANSKHASLDPYSQLYIYTKHCLNDSYKSLNIACSPTVVELLTNVIELIQRCPTTLSPGFLANIQGGLAPWLLDEDGKLGSRSSTPLSQFVTTLWTRICALIEGLPVTDSNTLRTLEPLLCSAFGSRHRSIVSATIMLWNSTFGSQAMLEYPPCILVALQRLQGIADLQLPSFPKNPEDEVISAKSTFLEDSQDDNIPYISIEIDSSRKSTIGRRNTRLQSSPLPQLGRPSSPHVTIEVLHSSSSRKRPFDGTPEPTKRKAIKKDITPKLRHDNSQIQFTTIESSPLGDAILDSQLLTDRQREVRERQNEAGTLFADLRPSPSLKAQASLSKLGLGSELPIGKQRSPDVPTTPIISKQDKAPYDNYITSSPTPRRGSVEMQVDSDAFEPPSSPPEAPFERAKSNIDVSSADANQIDNNFEVHSRAKEARHLASARSRHASLNSTDLGPSAQVVDEAIYATTGNSSTSESLPDDYTSKLSAERPTTPMETSRDTAMEPQAARTPNEIFVDALSSPATPSPIRNVNSDDLYADALPSPLRKSVLERATTVSHGATTLITTPTNQQDLQTSFSFSEADEDSILRLITKFDGAAPLHNLSSLTNEEDIIQSSLLSEVRILSEPVSAEKDDKPNLLRSKNLNIANTVTSQLPRDPRLMTVKHESRKNKTAYITSRQTRSGTITSTIPESPIVEAQTTREETKRTKRDIVEGMGASIMDDAYPAPSDLDTEMDDSVNIAGRADVDTSSFEKDYEHDALTKSNPVHDQGKMGDRTSDLPSKRLSTTNETLLKSSPNYVNSDMASISLGSPLTGQKIITNFEQIINALGCVALTRAEAQKVENLLWDVKGELYAAEKRGRTTPKSG